MACQPHGNEPPAGAAPKPGAPIEARDLGDYTFAHDVRVAADGSRAYFEATRVDLAGNRYLTDIWEVGADGSSRRLTASGAEGRFEPADDGSVVFVSKRRGAQAGEAGEKPAQPGTDLFRIDPAGGEAELLACIPGLAVDGWRQVDAARLVLRCRDLPDRDAPAVVVEDLPFYENGGTYLEGSHWGLWLLDTSLLGRDRAAAGPALRLLTEDDEEVGSWTLDESRTRAVFASRRYTGLRPVTDELWALDLPQAGEGASAAPARTLLDDQPLKRRNLAAWREGVLYLATDMRAHGANEDPVPWVCPLDGGEARPLLDEAPDLCYGASFSCDALYGGGRDAVAAGGTWYALTTEFDRTRVRRLAPGGGALDDIEGLPGSPLCLDTADGRTLWCVCAGEDGLPEVYRVGLDRGPEEPGTPCAASCERVTDFSAALAGKEVTRPEAFEFSSNGDTLTGYVVKPLGYRPGTSYPGVLEVHGGPKVAYGPLFSHEMQALAAQGRFVFFTNPHGSCGRGGAFADIRERYGQEDFADLMAFTDEVLRRYPDVDPARLAIMGGSYGGFMVNWAIGHTDRFRCANSQRSIANYMTKCLVSDIGAQVNMPELLGDPEALAFEGENPAKIWAQSPLAYAANASTPTLFLHSDEDYRCPLEEGMQMYAALMLRGVPARLVVFRGEHHGLSRQGRPQNRVRRLDEIAAWYRRWLDGVGGPLGGDPRA